MASVTLDRLVRLYASSMGLALLARRLVAEAEQLKRMALNTEVHADREQRSAAVFQVLSRSLNAIAADVRRVASHVHAGAQRVAASAIASAARARLLEKYRQALDQHQVPGATGEAIRQRLAADAARLDQGLAIIAASLSAASCALRNLEHLHQHLPVIGTLLRVEASRDRAGEDALLAGGRALDGLGARLGALLNEVGARADDTMGQLAELGADERGPHAASHAP